MRRNRTNGKPRHSSALEPLTIGGVTVKPGSSRKIELPVSRLCTGTDLSMPVLVLRGERPGPSLWISAAVHGDEINGVGVIQRVLRSVSPADLAGTLIAVPVVNVFGFFFRSRYLHDRRDLNRSFPGAAHGSMASQLAHLFMTEVVAHCDYGIDLHTGSNQRTNLPQIRADLKNSETRRVALAFGAPIVMHGEDRPGSLRGAARERGAHVLLYEAGEPLRFNPDAIELGAQGVLRTMKALDMLDAYIHVPEHRQSLEVRKCCWVRAAEAGLAEFEVELGAFVEKGQRLGVIADSFGNERSQITSPMGGVVIGLAKNPLVVTGDAIVHLCQPRKRKSEP